MNAINEHIKEELKRFFEYAFRYNPQYWQEISGWEVLGKESARTRQDTATINRLLSTVVTSEQHLKRIIGDSALDSAKELKYYAYLFLKDMGKAEEPAPKLPEVPAQFTDSYDNPNKLLEIVMDLNKSHELRQQALKRVKEFVLWCGLPDEIFDREIFNRKKFEDFIDSVTQYGNFTIIQEVLALADERKPMFRYKNEPFGYLTDYTENADAKTIAFIESAVRSSYGDSEKVISTLLKVGHRYLDALAIDKRGQFLKESKDLRDMLIERYTKKVKLLVQRQVEKYRKEQDEEYPTLLTQYEKSLEPARFPEHAVTEIEDITDKRYVILKDKLGEAKANKFWNSHEKLLKGISGKFGVELKNIFTSRLFDISIIAPSEQNKIIDGLGEFHEYMFWGDSMNIQVIDPSAFNIVSKDKLFVEEQNNPVKETDKANHIENEDL